MSYSICATNPRVKPSNLKIIDAGTIIVSPLGSAATSRHLLHLKACLSDVVIKVSSISFILALQLVSISWTRRDCQPPAER